MERCLPSCRQAGRVFSISPRHLYGSVSAGVIAVIKLKRRCQFRAGT
jgi:hypothetical protein